MGSFLQCFTSDKIVVRKHQTDFDRQKEEECLLIEYAQRQNIEAKLERKNETTKYVIKYSAMGGIGRGVPKRPIQKPVLEPMQCDASNINGEERKKPSPPPVHRPLHPHPPPVHPSPTSQRFVVIILFLGLGIKQIYFDRENFFFILPIACHYNKMPCILQYILCNSYVMN